MINVFLICMFNLEEKIQGSKLLKELKGEKDLPWVAGENERFKGMTFKDASVISGNAHKLRPDTIPLARSPKINISIPMSYNFTERFPQCDFGVLDQGKCGSCWSFAVSKSFSHRYCRKYNKPVLFSQSHLVVCDRRNSGCGGGIEVNAWRYIDLRGLPLDSCQPYDGNITKYNCSKKCINESETYEAQFTEYWSVARYASIEEMQIGIMTEGPVTTSLKVYSDLMYYKSGIYTHTKGEFLGHHAVEIIGWGTKNGIDYWIISNSWNTTWGMNGLFLIKRGVNECHIEDYVCAGKVK